MYRVFALLTGCALAGCAQGQLIHQSDAINRASADTMSEHVLLNAVRASLDMPMSFTKLQKYTAQSMTSGSFAPKIPFGPGAVHSNDLGPTLNLSPGPFQIEYADVNTAGGLSKLNQSIGYDVIHRYAGEGISFNLVSTIFVQSFHVHAQLAIALIENLKTTCADPKSGERVNAKEIESACKGISAIVTEEGETCAWWNNPDSLRLGKGRDWYYQIDNHASDKCDYLKFQSFWLTLRVAGYDAELSSKTEKSTTLSDSGTGEKKPVTVDKTTFFAEFGFDVRSVQTAADRISKRLKDPKLAPLMLNARTPRSTLSYLGELIALKNFTNKDFDPFIITRAGTKIDIFKVVRGPVLQPAAISIVGPNGDIYSVLYPDYGAPNHDLTLRVLTMTSEVVNGAISEKDFPAPTSIVVRTIQ